MRILEEKNMTALQRQHTASAQKMAVCISYLNIVGAIDMVVMDLYTPDVVLYQGIKMCMGPVALIYCYFEGFNPSMDK